jgi:hypothetical protein
VAIDVTIRPGDTAARRFRVAGVWQPGIGGQGPMRISVGADDVGEQHRVSGIGFGTRHRIPCPIPRGANGLIG